MRHNNGTISLSRGFSLFMAQQFDLAEKYVPQYLDLQYLSNPEGKDISVLSNWETYLKRVISITGPEVSYENRAYKIKGTSSTSFEKNWVTTFRATIPYNTLVSPVDVNDSGMFRFFLLSDKIDASTTIDRRLAWVDISAEDLSQVEPGTVDD